MEKHFVEGCTTVYGPGVTSLKRKYGEKVPKRHVGTVPTSLMGFGIVGGLMAQAMV